MRRVLPWIVLLLLALAALHPLLFYGSGDGEGAVSDPTRITRYDAVFDVDVDGSMAVTETLAVEVPEGEERRGIFRFFDEADPHAERTRRVPFATTVTRDGKDEPHEWTTSGGGQFHTLRIGEESVILDPGVHTYVLTYRTDRVLVAGAGDGARFHWDLVPGGWAQEIDEAKLTVSLPEAPQDVACGVGAEGTPDCTTTLSGDSTVIVEASGLAPRQRVTLRADLPGLTPSADELPWSRPMAQVLGADWKYVGFVAAGVLFAGWLGRRLARRTIEAPAGAPLQYAPPSGVGPHQALFVARETVPKQAFVAALMHAAERGAITLRAQGEKGRDWKIKGTGQDVELDEVTGALLDHLGVRGEGRFLVRHKDEAAGSTIQSATTALNAQTREWAMGNGLLAKGGPGKLGVIGVIGAFALYLLLVIEALPSTSMALVPGAFAAMGLPMLYSGSSTLRTPSGRDLWARVNGFERVLSTPSGQERFDFSGRHDLYTAYLPWAVAFGCAEAWEAKYTAETGHPAPEPHYAYGFAAVGAGSVAASMAESFSSTVSSAVSAYQSEQSSSSSSSGGGVSGGGGGGGGGSW